MGHIHAATGESSMKETGLMFKAPLVRAILEGAQDADAAMSAQAKKGEQANG